MDGLWVFLEGIAVGVGLTLVLRRGARLGPGSEIGSSIEEALDDTTAATDDDGSSSPVTEAKDAPTGEEGASEPPPERKPLGPQLLEIADDLEANEAQRYADPHDILGNVLFEDGVALLTDPAVPLEQVLGYALGTNWVMGIMGAEALARRPDAASTVERVLDNIGQTAQWPLFFRLRAVSAHAEQPVIGRVLTAIDQWWEKEPVTVNAVDEFVAERVAAGEALTFGGALEGLAPGRIEEIESFVRRLDPRRAEPLSEELARSRQGTLDPAFVRSAGRLWTQPLDGPPVVETESVAVRLEEMRSALDETPPRPILVVGEPGVGKSALLRLFSGELIDRGWRIFETSGTQLLAGTRYVGDIETRVSQLRENTRVEKGVVVYVDGLAELRTAGRTSERPVGVLDQIWPHVKSRELFLVAEVGSGAYETLERAYPGLASVMKVVRVGAAEDAETVALVESMLARSAPGLEPAGRKALAEEVLRLARSYLTHRALPGSAAELVAAALTRLDPYAPRIDRRELLGALSDLTGLPAAVLDERQSLDVAGLRQEFRRRVIGQDEAVDCLVERIAMLKAGLVDPKRPIGVFLFAGPSGTGKTEIAKALAELLFGSPEQMIRLDMSELQTPESLARLLGEGDSPGDTASASLVRLIRQHPFSVVLLDEFEKAHPNVWDLFLQVFDDGRLTDRRGETADFRHAIIILTSNLGARIRSEDGIGFVGSSGRFSVGEVERVVKDTFRQEFVNRLDRVVVFRPLSREVMRDILRKELDEALSRRGFQSKEWAVEWEASAIEFLLSEGFTPDLGARPLRRAIERRLLAPLALTIVENRAPEGEQFLFVRSDGKRIEVEFVDPDAEIEALQPPEGEDAADALSVRAVLRRATGSEAEQSFLIARAEEIGSRLEGEEWRTAKDDGLAQINADGFWDRDDRYDVLDRVELMDRIESAGATVASLAERLRRSKGSTSLNARVAEKLYVLEEGLRDLDEARPGMAYLSVRLLVEDADHAEAPGFAGRIADMYASWAAKRGMRSAELTAGRGRATGERTKGGAPTSERIFSIAGFGSHGILSGEVGLHVLESPRDESKFDRVRVRVAVAPRLLAPDVPREEALADAREALADQDHREAGATVVRRYREAPSPLVRDTTAGWRTGRIDAIWAGAFDVWS